MLYRREIDGLRALAVVPVIFYHAGFDFFSGGFVGVDVFFVISGYLITSIIYTQMLSGTFTYRDFYERRARRILPALFTVIATCLPFAYILLSPDDINSFSNSLISLVFFSSNILFWFDSGYFDKAAELKPLLHTWSLSVEEQYYLIFPVLLVLLKRVSRKFIIFIVASFACISLYLMLKWATVNTNTAFYLLPFRGWEILCGALIALIYPNESINKTSIFIANVFGIAGFCFLMFSILFFDSKTPFPSWHSLIPVFGTVLLIIFTVPGTYIGKLLSHHFLVSIGLVSYSAYLWHQPLFAFSRHYFQNANSIFLFTFLITVCALLSFFTWKFVESPFRDRKLYSQQIILKYALLGGGLCLAVGLLGVYTKGFYQLKISNDQRLVLNNAIASPMRKQCHTSGKDFIPAASACEYHNGAVKIAAFGDSHIVEIAYALANDLSDRNIKVKHFSFSSCIPTYGQNYSGLHKWCSKWTNEAIQYIVNNKNIDTVIVSYRIHAHLFGKHDKKYPVLINNIDDAEREIIWDSYIGTLKYFRDHGKKVILILQAPELPKDIGKVILSSSNPYNKIDGVSKSWWEARSSFVSNRLTQIPAGVFVIDPQNIFCNSLACIASNNGVPFYFDDNHLSVNGAALITKEILPLLKLPI
jgi:peptidoglycan/LPS O-acetylase OafA/YrhL